jgi:hypothetical protein
VVGQHHGAARHEAVDQLLRLPHLSGRRRPDGRGGGGSEEGVGSPGVAGGGGGSGS